MNQKLKATVYTLLYFLYEFFIPSVDGVILQSIFLINDFICSLFLFS